MKILLGILFFTGLPAITWAHDTADTFHGLQQVLENLYEQMIPLCSQLINVGRGIAGFAALWFIAARVWGHISRAEPIDFYPLFRPFLLGFCIAIFPMVLSLINGVLQPTVSATDAMVNNTNQALYAMLDGKRQELTNPPSPASTSPDHDPEKWYQYTHPDNSGDPTVGNSNPISELFSGFSIKNMIKKWIAELLELCYMAAALCIDTIRTFKLIVLAILGPLVFGLSVFDGFQHTLKHWLARYINVFMWLPVANIFGAITAKIQLNMMQMAASGGNTSPFFGYSNTAYLIFLLIAIVGYFAVPSIAGYIVHVGGHALLSKTSAVTSAVVSAYTGMVMREVSQILSKNNSSSHFERSSPSPGPQNNGHPNEYLAGKLTGKT